MSETGKAPTPRAIDALIAEYAQAQEIAIAAGAEAKAKTAIADAVKVRLTAMVEEYGARHTDKSKRLAGLHNTATTTTATRVSVDAGAVDAFKSYLDQAEMPELVDRFFSTRVTYSLVEGPADVLKTLSLGKRVHTKISSLLGLCFQVKTNTPSLKVEVVAAAKP